MNNIELELLKQIADINEAPNGAYNIRKNGQGIERKVTEKGYTLIPLNFYLKNGRVKVSLGVCKGKKQFDKRATIKQRDVNRDIQREFSKELKR